MTIENFREIGTLHELLDVAIADGLALTDDPKIDFDSGEWVRGRPDGTCDVCLAGAVMVRSLGVSTEADLTDLRSLGGAARRRIKAIDSLRNGDIVRAYELLHDHDPDGKGDPIPDGVHDNLRELEAELAGYDPTFISREGFLEVLEDMNWMRDRLAAENL